MSGRWQPISRPFAEAGDSHDVVVVGSGYGGGVAASRLARVISPDTPAVTVLERGREILPGEYPDNPVDASKEMQVTLSSDGRTIGHGQGLYDLRVGPDVNVLLGCGLGGTSLINANVAIEPDKRVYDHWPKVFRDDRALLEPYFDRAREMLGSKPYPEGKTPPKLAALERVAEGTGMAFGRPDINVSFTDGYNAAGVWQSACTDCGDCVSGCNYGAKNTVLMNYLPDAAQNGAKIYTGAEVLALARDGELWRIVVRDITPRDDRSLPPVREISAHTVILAAGTLGSTEILKRSDGLFDRFDPALKRRQNLVERLSPALGQHFSGNGDVWSFGYNANIPKGPEGKDRAPVFAVGAGRHEVRHGPVPSGEEAFRPGPCITGMATITDPVDVTKSVLVEEGVMPGALAPVYAAAFPALDAMLGDPYRFGDTDLRLMDAKALGLSIKNAPFDFAETVYSGPVSRTMPFLVMSHDASDGELRLENDRITVDWPQAGGDPALLADEAVIKRACDAISAEYLPNPLWQDAFGRRIVTVHPLGGCAMADSVEHGVVNDRCEVFDTSGGIHGGLYVCDGAVLPRAVGVNPHLTITAVAERAVELLAARHKWGVDLAPIEPPDTTPMEDILRDVVKELNEAIAGLEQLKTAIDGKAWELSAMILKGIWRTLTDSLPRDKLPIPDADAVVAAVGDADGLTTVVEPILDQALEVLLPLSAALSDGSALTAWEVAENQLGDFSPPVSFKESMVGHVSMIGTDDPAGPFDPYEAAGAGKADCVFTATISAGAVREAITPPKGTGDITEATLASESLGTFTMKKGTFRFLMPDPERIECWEMVYEGTLEETGGEGRTLWFEGRKRLQYREGSHWWKDLTVLAVDIRTEKGEKEAIARGQLLVTLEEALRQAEGLEMDYKRFGLLSSALLAYDHLESAWDEGRGKSTFAEAFKDKEFRANAVKAALYGADPDDLSVARGVALAYKAKVFARMAGLVLRTYGGVFSYMMNFPGETAETPLPHDPNLPVPEEYFPEPEPGVYVKLTRYPARGNKGPVVLAGGFGTRASSFASPTAPNLAAALWEEGYDVWLFDYRGSGEIEASQLPFTLDDVARKDWPAAIDLILDRTRATSLKAVVHCIGSMSLFMAILAGETRVRSVVASQLAVHAITNWFNFAKGDAETAKSIAHGFPKPMVEILSRLGLPADVMRIARNGLPVVDPRSPSGAAMRKEKGAEDLDATIDAMLWKVPSFAPVPCLSPTCHRINFVFGPSYRHEMLNEATHDAIQHMFGPVSTTPFIHISQIFETGHIQSADGSFDYMDAGNIENLRIPIHFIAGGRNQEMLPEATLRTLDWLRDANHEFRDHYTRRVFPEFGHMDCFIGKAAHKDIFPDILDALKRHG